MAQDTAHATCSSWPGRAGWPPGRVLVRLTFSFGRFLFLLCLAPSGQGLPLPWSFVCPPLPLFLFFFFVFPLLSSLRPLCLLLSLVSGPGCPEPWRCVLFVLLASRFLALRVIPLLWCCLAVGCSLAVALPPPPFVSRCFCRRSVPCFRFFFFLCAHPLSPAFSVFRLRVPWALALCFVFFVGLPLPGSPCALASFVCPAWPLAASWWLPPPPPFCVSRFSSLPLGAPFPPFSFFPCVVRPRCLWLSLVSGPGCPGPRCSALFALLASRFLALRALSPLSCFLPGRWLLPGGFCPPPPFLSRGFRRCRSVLCAVCCAVLCVPWYGAAPRCCALCRPVLCCCVLCCFVALLWRRCLLCRALWRCPSPWGPVLCGAVFCGVPPRCVLCAVCV